MRLPVPNTYFRGGPGAGTAVHLQDARQFRPLADGGCYVLTDDHQEVDGQMLTVYEFRSRDDRHEDMFSPSV